VSLVFGQDERVTSWVSNQLGYVDPPPAYTAIGFERGGELVGGVYFDGMSETNVFAHIASSATVMPTALLAGVCHYIFALLGKKRMTFMVYDDNYKCLALVRGLGATLEGRLKGGHASGDVLLFAFWSDAPFYQRLIETGRIARLETAGQL